MNITERELLERLRSNLMERETDNVEELYDEIVIAFEDAEIDGVTDVVIRGFNDYTLETYLNHADSHIYCVEYAEDMDMCKVVDVYM